MQMSFHPGGKNRKFPPNAEKDSLSSVKKITKMAESFQRDVSALQKERPAVPTERQGDLSRYMWRSEQKSHHIVEVRPDEQAEQKEHSHHLCIFQKFVAWFAACDDFIKKEQYVPTVKRRNRKDVHHCQHHGQQSGHFPKTLPVPCFWENASDGTESAQTLGPLFREHIFHVVDISFQRIHSQCHTGGE